MVASAALDIALPVDPGEHVVSTQAPGGTLWEQRITIVKGDKKAVVLEVKAAPIVELRPAAVAPVVPTTTPEPTKEADPSLPGAGPSSRRVAVYAIGGVGVAGLVLGGVMGGLAAGKKTTIEAHCGATIHQSNPLKCDPTGLAAVNSGQTFALVSTIGVVAGLAAVGTAAVLLVTEHKPAKTATGARRPWIAPDVLSIGPSGATLGARGSF